MPEGKLKVYNDEEVTGQDPGRRARGLDARGRLAAAQVQHRRLADDADAGQRRRLPVRGGLAPRRPVGHLGQGLGQAQDPLRGRNHRQGLRPGTQDRGGRPLAARAGRSARGNAQQVRSDQEVRHQNQLITGPGPRPEARPRPIPTAELSWSDSASGANRPPARASARMAEPCAACLTQAPGAWAAGSSAAESAERLGRQAGDLGLLEAAAREVDPLERRDGLQAGGVLCQRLAKGVGADRPRSARPPRNRSSLESGPRQ